MGAPATGFHDHCSAVSSSFVHAQGTSPTDLLATFALFRSGGSIGAASGAINGEEGFPARVASGDGVRRLTRQGPLGSFTGGDIGVDL